MALKQSNIFGPQGFRECWGDYRAEADLEDPSCSLYRFQRDLPRLPVPLLKESIELYLETLRPLTSPAEFARAKELAIEFLRPSGIGEKLQSRLLARAKDRNDSSYLAEWWNTLGYLQVRDPVVFNVSYFIHFADSVHPKQRSNIGRAAALLRGSVLFAAQVANGSIEPEQLGKNKTPLCATAYKYMFNACRIPRRKQDSYRIYDPMLHTHAVVMRHNNFFLLELLDPRTKDPLGFEALCFQLARILDAAGAKGSAIGVLTSQDRDLWADAREELIQASPLNQKSLHAIESSLLVLNLDDDAPVSRTEVARGLWHGNGRNRFFDKCVQIVVFENGKAGLLGEHSMLDGMPMARFCDYLLSRLHKGQIDLGPRGQTTQQLLHSLVAPKQLMFRFTSKTLYNIAEAEKVFDQTVIDHEVFVQTFYGYGARSIKGFRCSPDAFVQLAIQLAYKKLFRKNVATYEASQTRTFLHGRTETTRSCSAASAKFTDAMTDASGTITVDEKRKLLLAAASAHVAYMRKAGAGRGVDRHFLGLKLLVQPGERVPFFEDPVMTRASHWLISTSHLTNELFDGWGWGEVVPEGVGIAYSVKDLSIQFNIACRQHGGWAARLGHLLEESLFEMQQLFAKSTDIGAKL
ncbi:carnitine o-acetyltransferase [Plasmopara halstedii]|uniref:Carnitine o-acetyltransferase n=1 Tax=Plasmopara halstedii TaxID=4781 RepID=A0A0P1ADV8_PLAHL|nr:carnitine o-acetyltransferase [Plasmopara halstedii]CEG38794.1 carnitine o-acetyltransferase [Plasmopara halstedii]|eukprot:XP_024575163.1 carnitine o-acetyltransferase [Plasmopara halstedii]